jgi:hypothetical protein
VINHLSLVLIFDSAANCNVADRAFRANSICIASTSETVLGETRQVYLIELYVARFCNFIPTLFRVTTVLACGTCEHVALLLRWNMYSENCGLVIAILNAVIVLSDTGGKELRCRLGRCGLCAVLTEVIKWNRLRNRDGEVLEYACTAMYQLIIGSFENRFLLRKCGADKELYCLLQHSYFLPYLQQQLIKEKADKLLRLLKDQVIYWLVTDASVPTDFIFLLLILALN